MAGESTLPKCSECLEAFYAGDAKALRKLLTGAPSQFVSDINGASFVLQPISGLAVILMHESFSARKRLAQGFSLYGVELSEIKANPEGWVDCLRVFFDVYKGQHDFREARKYLDKRWTASLSLAAACAKEFGSSLNFPELREASERLLDVVMEEPFGIREPDELSDLMWPDGGHFLQKILSSPNVRFDHDSLSHKFEEAAATAAARGSIDALAYFESQGVDYSKRIVGWVSREWRLTEVVKETKRWEYALHRAQSVEVAEWLLAHGADPHFREIGVSGGGTPLFSAISNKELKLVRWYVEKQGASLTVRDDLGMTPLLHACAFGGSKELKYLVDKGADVHALSVDGSNAAFSCGTLYSSGAGRKLKILAECGVQIDRPNAAGKYYVERIRGAPDRKYLTQEIIRRHEIGEPLSQEFVRGFWDVLATSRGEAENLYRLARSGVLDLAHYKEGVNNPLHGVVALNPVGDLGVTVDRFLAGTPASVSIASELLAHGLPVDLRNERGYTPLMEAVSRKNVAAAKFLIEMGADPDLKTLKGRPLASLTRTDSIRRELLSDGMVRNIDAALGEGAEVAPEGDFVEPSARADTSSGSYGML